MAAPPALVRRLPARTARPRGRGLSGQKLGSCPRSRGGGRPGGDVAGVNLDDVCRVGTSNQAEPSPQKSASRVAASRPRMCPAASSRLTPPSGRLGFGRRPAARGGGLLRAVEDRQSHEAADGPAAVGAPPVDGGHVHGVDPRRRAAPAALAAFARDEARGPVPSVVVTAGSLCGRAAAATGPPATGASPEHSAAHSSGRRATAR